MMKPKRVAYALVAQAVNNIATSQTPGAAGNLVLDGALSSGGVMPAQTLGYKIAVSSVGDNTANTFIVTGTDQDGKAQTETIAGTSGTASVGTKFWKSISSIAINAVAATAVQVGTVNTVSSASTQTFPVDIYEFATSASADVSGTINYDIQKCFERPTAGETPNWISDQAGKTGDAQMSLSTPIGGVRVLVNSYSNSATLALSILQSRSSDGQL